MIGKTISHYKILEKLGSGGMGVVYKARDLRLDRFVALKFLPPHLTQNEEDKQRFIQEAKAASALDHNNICTIHEIDQTDDGQLFISMACYDGETLEDKIKDERLKIKEIIYIAIQIAEGLNKAHEKGIVHRDIKPANIMLTTEGVVKILDFGLAKLSEQTKITKDLTTMGSVTYMSPEQTKGTQVDHRTDIWSLGVVLYEMITGRPPFKGEYDTAVVYSILNELPEPVSALRDGIPAELERIINKSLQKAPVERFQHMDELRLDLQQIGSSSGINVMPDRTRGQRSVSRLLKPAIIGLSIIMAFIIGYVVTDSEEERASAWENSIAVLPFENISNDPEQEYFCDGMTEQIISNLARLPNLKVISRTSVMHYRATTKTIPEIGRELNVEHVLEGSVRKYENRLRITAQLVNTRQDFSVWTENFDREYRELFDIQDEVSESIAANLLANLSRNEISEIKTNRPKSTQAYEFYLKGRYYHYNKYWGATINPEDFKISEEMFLKAIDLDPDYALSYANLADLYNTYYRTSLLPESEHTYYLNKQRYYLDKALDLDSNLAEVQIIKSWIKQDAWEIPQAYHSVIKALRTDPNSSYANAAMGRFLHARGLMEQAHEYFEKAIETDPLQPMHLAWNSYCLTMSGNYQESEVNIARALEIDPDHFVAIVNQLLLLLTTGRYDEAEVILEKYDGIFGKNINMMSVRALLFAVRGDKERALNTYPEGHYYKYYIYAALNMKDEAIGYLNRLFDERLILLEESRYLELYSNPILNDLRSDPRFPVILENHKRLYEEDQDKYGRTEKIIRPINSD